MRTDIYKFMIKSIAKKILLLLLVILPFVLICCTLYYIFNWSSDEAVIYGICLTVLIFGISIYVYAEYLAAESRLEQEKLIKSEHRGLIIFPEENEVNSK